MKKILITGGLGYIGSHAVVVLSKEYDIIVLDNLNNAKKSVIQDIEKIINKKITFKEGDIRDKQFLDSIFSEYEIDAVVHFAGLKAVGESVENPIDYYNNNVNGTIQLILAMKEHNVKKIIFSSSATVYGEPDTMPIREDFPVGNTTNPYGATKYFIECILRDLYNSDNEWTTVILRYFNPVGAHESGLIGEDPAVPNNLMPYITKTAAGELQELHVFGDDYNTPDGTGIRDYIHVMDLAEGHLAALKKITGFAVINLGTSKGYSVLEMIHAFEKINKIKVNYKISPRRNGDIACCYADASLAKDLLNWEAKRGIEEMVASAWKYQRINKEKRL